MHHDHPLVLALFLLGPLAGVPLALAATRPSDELDTDQRRYRVARWLWPPAAALVVAAMWVPRGWLAAGLTLPWAVFTGLIGLLGVLRLVERSGRGPASELAIDAGFVFLPVGGAWLAASRLGEGFLGFEEPLVFLTAAHFHFAGCVLPIVTGLLARALPGRASAMAVLGVTSGVPLTAVGITLAKEGLRWPELVAALWLAAAGLLVAALELRLAFRVARASQRALAVLSSASLALAMLFASTYAVGRFTGAEWLDIPFMLAAHAPLAILGFALPAVVFWRRLAAADGEFSRAVTHAKQPCFAVVVRWLGERLDGAARRLERTATLCPEYAPRAGDVVIAREVERGCETPGAPLSCGIHEATAAAIVGFEIFPPALLERVGESHDVERGAIVVCRYRLLPGVDVLFASRVTERFDELRDDMQRTGFTYRTLAGHPFVGEETFEAVKDTRTGRVTMSIRSWSRPSGPLLRLLGPWVRRVQRRSVEAALSSKRA